MSMCWMIRRISKVSWERVAAPCGTQGRSRRRPPDTQIHQATHHSYERDPSPLLLVVHTGSSLASHDYSSLPLKSDHQSRPIWVCADGRVFLETYNSLYRQAYDFLIAIADPVTRPQFIHEYQISSYSLYAAASLGLETADIISGLQRLSKVALSQDLCDFIREKTETCGKAKLLLKRTQYFVESIYPDTLDALLRNPIIAAARIDNRVQVRHRKRREGRGCT